MRAIWTRIRAFLRGPSEEELDRDLSDIKRRLADLEGRHTAKDERLADDLSNVARFIPSARRRGLEG